MNQAIAQTVVFSFLQRQENKNLFLVPNVLFSAKEFRVIMYDSENDYLICSQPLCIFTKSQTKWILDKQSIFFLWMVLHYGIFSGTVNLKDIFKNNVSSRITEALNAEFIGREGVAVNVYRTQLKFCKESILRPKEEYFPDMNSLKDGENVFPSV